MPMPITPHTAVSQSSRPTRDGDAGDARRQQQNRARNQIANADQIGGWQSFQSNADAEVGGPPKEAHGGQRKIGEAMRVANDGQDSLADSSGVLESSFSMVTLAMRLRSILAMVKRRPP